jgi:hypothetical protein
VPSVGEQLPKVIIEKQARWVELATHGLKIIKTRVQSPHAIRSQVVKLAPMRACVKRLKHAVDRAKERLVVLPDDARYGDGN